jgi:hypothetical protein
VDLEFRCPIHGKVTPEDPDAEILVCSATLRRRVDGKLKREKCRSPLTAYVKDANSRSIG